MPVGRRCHASLAGRSGSGVGVHVVRSLTCRRCWAGWRWPAACSPGPCPVQGLCSPQRCAGQGVLGVGGEGWRDMWSGPDRCARFACARRHPPGQIVAGRMRGAALGSYCVRPQLFDLQHLLCDARHLGGGLAVGGRHVLLTRWAQHLHVCESSADMPHRPDGGSYAGRVKGSVQPIDPRALRAKALGHVRKQGQADSRYGQALNCWIDE